MKQWPLGKYGLSIVLGSLFVLSWIAQTYFGWNKYVAEQQAHHEQPQVFGTSGYLNEWGQSTFENWQSEFLQLLAFVVLTTLFIHKGSHESRDSDDELKEQIDRLERKLEEIAARQQEAAKSGPYAS